MKSNLPNSRWIQFWQACQQHREILSNLLAGNGTPDRDISIWGAGSCHDIDLAALTQRYRSVNLVDLQKSWIFNGIAFQQSLNESKFDNIHNLAPVDVAGITSAVQQAAEQFPERNERLQHVRQQVAEYTIPADLRPSHTVASTGLLSQLLVDVVEDLAQQHSDALLQETIATIRRRHIELMLDHLLPGGRGVLVIDFMTSDHVPELAANPLPADLEIKITKALTQGDYQLGLEPAALQNDLRHPSIQARVRDVQLSQVWRWSMLERHYVCYAICFRNAAPSMNEPQEFLPKN